MCLYLIVLGSTSCSLLRNSVIGEIKRYRIFMLSSGVDLGNIIVIHVQYIPIVGFVEPSPLGSKQVRKKINRTLLNTFNSRD